MSGTTDGEKLVAQRRSSSVMLLMLTKDKSQQRGLFAL